MGRTTEERAWVLLFDSIHYVLAAERAFKARGVWCDVVPVPRELSSDCGMAVEFRPADVETVRGMRAEGAVRPTSVHRRTADGYDVVEDTGPGEGPAGGGTQST